MNNKETTKFGDNITAQSVLTQGEIPEEGRSRKKKMLKHRKDDFKQKLAG